MAEDTLAPVQAMEGLSWYDEHAVLLNLEDQPVCSEEPQQQGIRNPQDEVPHHVGALAVVAIPSAAPGIMHVPAAEPMRDPAVDVVHDMASAIFSRLLTAPDMSPAAEAHTTRDMSSVTAGEAGVVAGAGVAGTCSAHRCHAGLPDQAHEQQGSAYQHAPASVSNMHQEQEPVQQQEQQRQHVGDYGIEQMQQQYHHHHHEVPAPEQAQGQQEVEQQQAQALGQHSVTSFAPDPMDALAAASPAAIAAALTLLAPYLQGGSISPATADAALLLLVGAGPPDAPAHQAEPPGAGPGSAGQQDGAEAAAGRAPDSAAADGDCLHGQAGRSPQLTEAVTTTSQHERSPEPPGEAVVGRKRHRDADGSHQEQEPAEAQQQEQPAEARQQEQGQISRPQQEQHVTVDAMEEAASAPVMGSQRPAADAAPSSEVARRTQGSLPFSPCQRNKAEEQAEGQEQQVGGGEEPHVQVQHTAQVAGDEGRQAPAASATSTEPSSRLGHRTPSSLPSAGGAHACKQAGRQESPGAEQLPLQKGGDKRDEDAAPGAGAVPTFARRTRVARVGQPAASADTASGLHAPAIACSPQPAAAPHAAAAAAAATVPTNAAKRPKRQLASNTMHQVVSAPSIRTRRQAAQQNARTSLPTSLAATPVPTTPAVLQLPHIPATASHQEQQQKQQKRKQKQQPPPPPQHPQQQQQQQAAGLSQEDIEEQLLVALAPAVDLVLERTGADYRQQLVCWLDQGPAAADLAAAGWDVGAGGGRQAARLARACREHKADVCLVILKLLRVVPKP